eukprot:scaffold27036_cov101-Isochrysis_galbana.AAC.1
MPPPCCPLSPRYLFNATGRVYFWHAPTLSMRAAKVVMEAAMESLSPAAIARNDTCRNPPMDRRGCT